MTRAKSESKDLPIGIDLGTTNSCVAVVEDGTPRVIPNGGYLTTPSVIAFSTSGKRLVGHPAKRQAITNPEHTIIAMKRLMGRTWTGLVDRTKLAYSGTLAEGPNGDVRVTLNGESYSLPQLNAMLLQELRAAAEDDLKVPARKAVITVPAYFDDNQRQATRDAGEIAGLEVLGIINEPTAAALAYGRGVKGTRTVVVYDLGGGTFDVSVVRTSPGGVFEVLATGGDTLLGGEDFDTRVMDWLLREANEEFGVDLERDRVAMQRLKFAAETAKCALGGVLETEINLPFLVSEGEGRSADEARHLVRKLTREHLDSLTEDLVTRTITLCSEVLAASKVTKASIDDVLLVGGSSRIGAVQAAVTAFFGKPPSQRVNPDEAVAIGAAIHADTLAFGRTDTKLLDVTPHTLGLLAAPTGGRSTPAMHPILGRNTRVPTERQVTFSTKKGQDNVDFVVMQGDRKKAQENLVLGKFRMGGFAKHEAKIDVTFAIDQDGIVRVTARDQASGREQSLRVTASSGLTRDEVAKMKAGANDFLVDKRQSKERTAATQEAEKAIALLEKGIAGVSGAVAKKNSGRAALSRARTAVEKARAAIDAGGLDAMAAATAELVDARKALGALK